MSSSIRCASVSLDGPDPRVLAAPSARLPDSAGPPLCLTTLVPE